MLFLIYGNTIYVDLFFQKVHFLLACHSYCRRNLRYFSKKVQKISRQLMCLLIFFFKQKTAYEIGLGIPAEPLFRSYIDHAAFLGTINPDTNKIPKHLFQGYLNIYNNYFKAPWMPDRTEANPNELNQDDARYGFRCCHLKNIWTAPLPPETELSRQ